MKKYLKIILAVGVTISFSIINFGCDQFNNFPVNIPITKQIIASGNNNNISGTGNYCIDQESDTFIEFRDKAKSLTFIQAAYRTKSVTASGVSAPNLKGDIVVTVKSQFGVNLFSVKIPNVNPSDFINKAFVLSLTQNQIQAMNDYFGNLKNTCFDGVIDFQNITGGTAPFEVIGVIDMVFEADTEL